MARIRYYDPDTQEWLLADAGGDENVQSDWEQSNTAADDYIKNKPILATVATTGDYSVLNGRPTYSVVASTGKYNDLIGKPDYDVYTDLTSSDYRSGSWSTTARSRTTNAKRITTTKMYPVKTGDKILYKTGVLPVYFAMYVGKSTSRTTLQDFTTAAAQTTYTIPYDGYLVIILKNPSDTNVSVSDYDADITIVNTHLSSVETTDKISEYMRNGYMSITASDMTDGQWVQRTLQNNSTTICNKELITVRSGDRIVYKTGDLLLHVGMYVGTNRTLTTVIDFTSAPVETSYVFTQSGVVTLTLKSVSGTDISVADYDADIKIINDFTQRKRTYTYYGERIQLNSFYAKEIITLNRTHGTPNDIAVYGNYLVSGTADGYLHFYNLNTNAEVGSMQITEGLHFNVLVFSKTKQNENDPFPLLYAETEGLNGLYLVIRIIDFTSYEIVKKYRFDQSDFNNDNPQIFFDFDYNVAYGVCKPAGSDLSKYIWYKFDLANETANQDGTYTPAILYQSEIPYPRTRQGAQIYHDRLYYMTSTSSGSPKVLVYNFNGVTPVVATTLPNLPFAIEGEGISIAENESGIATMYISSTQKVYKLTFNPYY
jgi:hypothetical protein